MIEVNEASAEQDEGHYEGNQLRLHPPQPLELVLELGLVLELSQLLHKEASE
jgi:hypothetical protein